MASGWGPAVPTEIWSPAVSTEIWRSRLRSGSALCCLQLAVEELEEEEKATLINSETLPHLAGGENTIICFTKGNILRTTTATGYIGIHNKWRKAQQQTSLGATKNKPYSISVSCCVFLQLFCKTQSKQKVNLKPNCCRATISLRRYRVDLSFPYQQNNRCHSCTWCVCRYRMIQR